MKKIYLLILIIWKTAVPLFAQEFLYEPLTVEDGLSQSSVLCITQDQKGFIWVGTRDGLNFYNGQDFKVFRKIPFDTNSVASNTINCLLPDGSNGLFVGTPRGLQRYDQQSNRFEKILFAPTGTEVNIKVIYRDRSGSIWAGTENGFYRILHDPVKNQFLTIPYLLKRKAEKDQLGYAVSGFLHDSNDNFWVTTAAGIFRMYLKGNQPLQIDPLLLAEPEKHLFQAGHIHAITEQSSGAVFASGEDKLYRLNEQKSAFTAILDTGLKDTELFGSQLGENPNGQLWASLTSGLMFISFSGDSISSTQVLHPPFQGVSQSRYKINYVLKDNIQKDFYWLASDLGGVIKMYKQKKQFHSLLLKNVPELAISNPYLRHIVADGNRIWINVGSGLLLANRNKGKVKFINDIFPPGFRVLPSSISSLYKSRERHIYAAILGGFIEIAMDENENILATYHNLNAAFTDNCMTFAESQWHLILGLNSGQISIVQKKDLKDVTVLSLAGVGSHPVPEITSLLLDNESNLWVGTYEGLYLYRKFIPGAHTFPAPLHLTYHPADTTGLIENRITALMQDSKNNIWICTRNGLMKAEEKAGKVSLKRILAPAIINQVLYGILEDKASGQYWLSSNNGLFRFDPDNGSVDNFDTGDGLQGNEFNTFSYYKSDSGEMFFGGTNGLTNFFPGDIQLDTLAPLLWITTLTTSGNQQFNLLARDSSTPLRLNFSQRSFSINFIGLDYSKPDNLKYYYTLSGSADLQRVPLGKSRQVNFSQLDPGNYTLQLFAVNSDGATSSNGDALVFTIRAPYWRMPWFYLLMTLVVAFLGWLMFYLRYQSKLKNLRAVEQVRKNISEDFHDELGSKLSIISMYSEFTKQELNKDNSKASVYLDKVNDTASRLYENTRDLIWALNPKHDSLYDLFLQLKDFGEEMFQDTGIEFHSAGLAETWKDKNLPMRYKRHLLLIFKEGMHNALKHSGCKSVKLNIDEKDQKLIIMLQDDGVGFDTTATHKGDGLKNMAQRAEHLQGGLHFISHKEGTRIWIELQQGLFN